MTIVIVYSALILATLAYTSARDFVDSKRCAPYKVVA